MNCARDALFAGSVFTDQKHRNMTVRQLTQNCHDRPHAWAYCLKQRQVGEVVFPEGSQGGILLVVFFHDQVAKRLGEPHFASR